MIFLSNVWFYSHVNYSVTKIMMARGFYNPEFYSHVNYSVTKISCSASKD